MFHFQDRTVHMVAVLLHTAAKLADVIKRKADSLLPERQLLFASIAEEANINVVLCKFHRRVACSEAGFQAAADHRDRFLGYVLLDGLSRSMAPHALTLKVKSPRLAVRG